MHIDQSANGGPVKQPGGIIGPKVDTAMTHRVSKIIMPVRAM